MFGWVTCRASSASRLKRAIALSSWAMFGSDRLQRDVLVQLQILGLVELAHAAAGDEAHDTEAVGDDLAFGERRWRCQGGWRPRNQASSGFDLRRWQLTRPDYRTAGPAVRPSENAPLPLTSDKRRAMLLVDWRQEHSAPRRRLYSRYGAPMTAKSKTDLLQGTLDLLILKTLALGPMHGWGISQRIQQISEDVLRVNQGSLYPALQRLEDAGWIDSRVGRLRKQPAGEVLPADEDRRAAARAKRPRSGSA